MIKCTLIAVAIVFFSHIEGTEAKPRFTVGKWETLPSDKWGNVVEDLGLLGIMDPDVTLLDVRFRRISAANYDVTYLKGEKACNIQYIVTAFPRIPGLMLIFPSVFVWDQTCEEPPTKEKAKKAKN